MHVGANPNKGIKSANGIPNPYETFEHVSKGNLGRAEPTPKRTRRTHTNARTPYMNASLSRKEATRGLWKSCVVGMKCTSEATPNRALRVQMESQTTIEI